MPNTAGRWTRDMVFALPDDGNRYELFDGELLVTPSPRPMHQMAVALLMERLARYVRRHHLGWVMTSPADLQLGGDHHSQPDLFVMPGVPADRESWDHFPDPILVVEVLSSSSADFDRGIKRRRFQRRGIPEYWIVDIEARAIERWRPQYRRPELLEQRIVWHPAGAAAALEIDLPNLFEEVIGH